LAELPVWKDDRDAVRGGLAAGRDIRFRSGTGEVVADFVEILREEKNVFG
jgi:hypothetical protein